MPGINSAGGRCQSGQRRTRRATDRQRSVPRTRPLLKDDSRPDQCWKLGRDGLAANTMVLKGRQQEKWLPEAGKRHQTEPLNRRGGSKLVYRSACIPRPRPRFGAMKPAFGSQRSPKPRLARTTEAASLQITVTTTQIDRVSIRSENSVGRG